MYKYDSSYIVFDLISIKSHKYKKFSKNYILKNQEWKSLITVSWIISILSRTIEFVLDYTILLSRRTSRRLRGKTSAPGEICSQ